MKEKIEVIVNVLLMFSVEIVIIGLISMIMAIPNFVMLIYGILFGFLYAHPKNDKVFGKQQ